MGPDRGDFDMFHDGKSELAAAHARIRELEGILSLEYPIAMNELRTRLAKCEKVVDKTEAIEVHADGVVFGSKEAVVSARAYRAKFPKEN